MYFSVNPAMIRSQSGQRLLREIPGDRILTETDGPFVKVGSGPARPSDVAVEIGRESGPGS
jgi:TatD DNase family protein